MNVILIGCGKMGSALLRGWLANNIVDNVYAVKPSDLQKEFKGNNKIHHFRSVQDLPVTATDADIALLSVKPQMMDEVSKQLKDKISANTLILSVATGKTISSCENSFGKSQPIVRSMPNTPSAVGKGMTVAVANKNISEVQKQQVEQLFKASGSFKWTQDENDINKVAAISGSGPAYIFLITEILAQVGKASGLDPAIALELARQTIIGAAALLEAEGNKKTPEELRNEVTSPGGSTAEAIKKFTENDVLKTIFENAINAAIIKNIELGTSPPPVKKHKTHDLK